MKFTGNRGEWSEPYALFKLLSDGELYLGDSNLNKIEGLVMPILAIIREEQDYKAIYSYEEKENVVIDLGDSKPNYSIPIQEFKIQADLLFEEIKKQSKNHDKKGSFSVSENIEIFLEKIGCTRLSAKSKSKSDIHITVHDSRIGACPTLGFSIKSEAGAMPTLINASGATNFIFKILNWDGSFSDEINNIFSSRKKKNGGYASDVKERTTRIHELGGKLVFQSVEHPVFHNNLVLIDSRMPEIVAEMLYKYFLGGCSTVSEIVDLVCDENPNGYNQVYHHEFYSYKIKRLLNDAALGMRPAEVWQGKYDATGGYLIIRKDGEIVCYHIYSRNEFEDYLFNNTKFDTPSAEKHGYGVVYEDNGEYFFKLNIQIRFQSTYKD